MTATREDGAAALAALADAYSMTGAAWELGPNQIYDRLSERVVGTTGVDWSGRRVLDVGAGTGAGSRALRSAGASPIATDVSSEMLRAATPPTPSAVADARALPIADAAVDGYLAAFCLNHLVDPEVALREAVRVVHPNGPIVVTAYAADDHHPVKAAVETAAAEVGWCAPRWAEVMRAETTPLLATVDRALEVAALVPLQAPRAQAVTLDFGDLGPAALVAWRLGMAQMAPFVRRLDPDARAHLVTRARSLLGDAPPLQRRIVVLQGCA